jgi:hypothetical protein
MDGSPARWIALIHQLHVAREEGGSLTMVAVFLLSINATLAMIVVRQENKSHNKNKNNMVNQKLITTIRDLHNV